MGIWQAFSRMTVGHNIVCALGCAAEKHRMSVFAGQAMGTYFRVTVIDCDNVLNASDWRNQVRMALDSIEGLMSVYRPDSEVSRFNESRLTDWTPVSPEIACVIRQALEVARKSSGAYDITVAPLIKLWSFGPGRKQQASIPIEDDIRAARTNVGVDLLDVRLDPPSIRKLHPNVNIDLSGIAKGFGVDQAAEALDRCRLTDYCIDVGGEIRTRGRNEQNIPWQVAIDRPRPGQSPAVCVVPLADQAMATSGDYRDFFERDGIRYCHEIDPRNGRPIRHNLMSVSVAHPSCTLADAWATALLVAGPEAGFALALENRLAAFFATKTPAGLAERWTPWFVPLISKAETQDNAACVHENKGMMPFLTNRDFIHE